MSDQQLTGQRATAEVEELLAEITLPSARGGRRQPSPLSIDVVRSLSEADLPQLLSPAPEGTKPPGIAQLRQSHHLLARTLAEGHSQQHASAITGYSPSYISILCDDEAFKELLLYYQQNKELIFADVAERMKTLGLHALEELQERLAKDPEAWKNREIMELAELLLVKGRLQPGGSLGTVGGASPGGVTVNVKFVTPGQQAGARGPVVDLQVEPA